MVHADREPLSGERYLDTQGRYVPPREPAEPPLGVGEAATLLGYLERQRATFAWKVSGLDEASLRVTVGASSMTLGGMLKHLARVEYHNASEWLEVVKLPPWDAIDWRADHGWDWRTAADDTPEQLYAGWVDAVARSRVLIDAALAAGGMDYPAKGLADGRGHTGNLRWILLNMIEEYARHNGHADLIRESIDGLIGHDPPQ